MMYAHDEQRLVVSAERFAGAWESIAVSLATIAIEIKVANHLREAEINRDVQDS